MYCTKCGNVVPEGAVFCRTCGNPRDLRRVSRAIRLQSVGPLDPLDRRTGVAPPHMAPARLDHTHTRPLPSTHRSWPLTRASGCESWRTSSTVLFWPSYLAP